MEKDISLLDHEFEGVELKAYDRIPHRCNRCFYFGMGICAKIDCLGIENGIKDVIYIKKKQ